MLCTFLSEIDELEIFTTTTWRNVSLGHASRFTPCGQTTCVT